MLIPTDTVQAVVNYLEDRPHKEVRALIDSLLACNGRKLKPEPEAEAQPEPEPQPREMSAEARPDQEG